MDLLSQFGFGGRVKSKSDVHSHEFGQLEFRRAAAVYKRFSTYEQVKSSRFSLIRQGRLEEKAIADGYKPALTPEATSEITNHPNYPGYYWNGQIVILEQDLGISGTKGQEERPGLAMLIDLIERDRIESVYVVDITRLFRDHHLITAPAFGMLCKEHGVIIVTEN